MTSLNPGLVLIVGAVLVPLLPLAVRRLYLLALPLITLGLVTQLEPGTLVAFDALGLTFEVLQVDRLSLVWGYIFSIAAFLGMIYAWHVDDPMQQVAAPIYAGAAIACVFAGDLVTLFVFWELTAISSVFLIWATRTEKAFRTGMRYLLIQVGSGVILLLGIVAWVADTGSINFGPIGIESLAGKLILIAFGIKAAFPFLHGWLKDTYPEATITGSVVLSAFTTKLAIYALARGYAGTEALIYIGAVMAVFPMFFALMENDFRRVLAYSLNNQLGFMVVGIGVGTELALNGTAAHAVNHILYKALLFMSVGAVLFRTGSCKGSELGGLFKSMPLTAGFCIVGAASISAVPLFAGFVSKAMILSAVAQQGHWVVWGALLFVSACIFHYCAVKIPYFTFFGTDSGRRVKEAPWNMLLAMGLASALCILIGVAPNVLYDILPYPVSYKPYTTYHVIQQMQMLMFSGLAFVLLMRLGLYPMPKPRITLDVDWIYRRLIPGALAPLGRWIRGVDQGVRDQALTTLSQIFDLTERGHGPKSTLSKPMHAGSMAIIVLSVLLFFMILIVI